MGEPVLSPGTIIRPEIDQESARKLIESLYGFKVQTIKEVKSYDDRNFYIEVGNDDEKSSNKKFVFKIANTIDSGVNGLFGMYSFKNYSNYLITLHRGHKFHQHVPLRLWFQCAVSN